MGGRAVKEKERDRGAEVECEGWGWGIGVVAEWVPPEVGLVGRGVGGGGVGCLGQNQYCGHPSLATPFASSRHLTAQIHPPAHLRLRSKSEKVVWRWRNRRTVWWCGLGCRCRVITTLKTRVALAHPLPPFLLPFPTHFQHGPTQGRSVCRRC